MDSLNSLAVFVQAAELRSFTASGKQLGVSASAVGKAISRLEDRLKVRLFNRSTRSIALTAEGALFLDRCRKIFEEVQAAELELARASSAPRGKLKISLPLIDMLLMPTITKFAKAYPEIELELDYSDRLVDVIEEGFDAVVRTGDASDWHLLAQDRGLPRILQAAFHPPGASGSARPCLPASSLSIDRKVRTVAAQRRWRPH
jgi:DNA-binding transcriptional LysR family regulator